MIMKNKDHNEDFRKLQQNFKEIEEIGFKFQEKGLDLVRYGKAGQKCAKFLKEELPKYEKVGREYPEFGTPLNTLLEWKEYALQKTNNEIPRLNKEINILDEISRGIQITVVSGNIVTHQVVSTINHTQIENPNMDIVRKYNIQKPKFIGVKEVEKELDGCLNKINPNLVKRRKGAWTTFYSVSSDKKAQAAHSLRDILSWIISQYAPNNEVKKAEWWEYQENTKDGVSLKQRLRFLLYGPKKSADEKELDIINSIVEECYKNYDKLKSIAHGSKKYDELIENIMHSMENTILMICRALSKNSEKGE